jgi:hypothetical protein
MDVGHTRVGGGGNASNGVGPRPPGLALCTVQRFTKRTQERSSNQPHAFLLYSSEESNS